MNLPSTTTLRSLAVIMAAVAVVGLLIGFWPVLLGQRILLGGNVMYACCLPWSAGLERLPLANPLLGDSVTQFVTWQEQVISSWRALQLPTWDPLAMSGKPLLANDQSAPFSPFTLLELFFPRITWGMSVAMIAKLLIAGIGGACYARAIRLRPLAQIFAGVAFAGSSFMVVWLAWPQSGVAALIPFVFAALEWYWRRPRYIALAAFALSIGIQFLVGHAETSLHLAFALAIYIAIRWGMGDRNLVKLLNIGIAGVLGVTLGAIQILPFLDALRLSTLIATRTVGAASANHFPLGNLVTWIMPNIAGNPALNGALGPFPNYNEGTGFAGLTMALLVPFGIVGGWWRNRATTFALLAVAIVSFGAVYTPLIHLVVGLPLLSASNVGRLLVFCCFTVAMLGAQGIDTLERTSAQVIPAAWGRWFAGLGIACFAALLILLVIFATVGPMHWKGWALLLALGVLAGVGAVFAKQSQAGLAILGGLLLLEMLTFTLTYERQVSPKSLPPASPVMNWVAEHTGSHPIVALGPGVVPPETAGLYGIPDVRGTDTLLAERHRAYWSAADPGYSDGTLQIQLNRPEVSYLQAAGVKYVLAKAGEPYNEGKLVHTDSGISIYEVPAPRPTVYMSPNWRGASDQTSALSQVRNAPDGTPVLEGSTSLSAKARAGIVTTTRPDPEHLIIQTNASSTQALVVLESWNPGWQAFIDGQSVSVHPANVAFQGVIVPAGKHTVKFVYSAPGLALGFVISVLAFLGVVSMVFIPRLRIL